MGLYKSKNITSANRTLTKWFNIFVRVRDADSDGNLTCISCGKKAHYNDNVFDAGHFVPSKYLATRWLEENVNSQCKGCNNSANGAMYQHGKGINKKYGDGTAEWILSLLEVSTKISKEERMQMAREYKSKAEELAKHKNITL